jgi:glycosyltransferase involved in cell wall biosynthesis
MEAMAMKRAVVATRVGGVPDMVCDGETGYLVKPEDPSAIAQKVSLLFKEEELRRQIGEAGKEFVAANCGHRVMIQRIEELYRGLTDKGRV